MNGNLTEFSREVKAQFFESFPLLLNLEHKIIESEENAFCIEIKAPSSKSEVYLVIDSSGEEVTVSFDSITHTVMIFWGSMYTVLRLSS